MKYEATEMGKVRVTVVIEDHLAEHIRQLFGGNLSKGVNTILERDLEKVRKADLRKAFGLLKGKVSTKDLEAMRQEEREADEQ